MTDITKIKFDDHKTIIEETFYDTKSGNGRDTQHRRILDRHPDFSKAMADLANHVVDVLCLPEGYVDGIKVSGISLSYNETQGRGVVVTCMKYLEGINAPFLINTPHLHQDESGSGKSEIPLEMDMLVDVIVKEARLFLGGKSSQEDMFANQPQSATAA